jgi:hypothetical protein
MRLYILRDGKPVETTDQIEWSEFMATGDRVLRATEVFTPGAETVRVSTVFLGLDHRYVGKGPPILWETMVFGGPHDGAQRRYSGTVDASEGHDDVLASLRHPVET